MTKRRPRAVSLVGQRFGALVVIRREGEHRKYAVWRCRCDCGAECLARSDRLRHGRKKACNVDGHFWMPTSRNFRGPSLAQQHPREYRTWQRIRERCQLRPSYKDRGITVCERWHSFENFFSDMGPRPTAQHSIDRIDNDGNYEPANCRWATAAEQMRNTRRTLFVEKDGQKIKLMDLLDQMKVPASLARSRLRMGWPLNKALQTPVHIKKEAVREVLELQEAITNPVDLEFEKYIEAFLEKGFLGVEPWTGLKDESE